MMRATLWQRMGEESEIVHETLRAIFGLAGIPLNVVDTQEALLAAAARARRASDKDILVIDCYHGKPCDTDRCVDVATRTRLPIYIVHPNADVVRGLGGIVGRPLVWLPSDLTVAVLRDKLHALRALAAADAQTQAKRPPLTERERDVIALLADNYTTGKIAGKLNLSEDTVNGYVQAMMRKFGVSSRRDLGRIWRAQTE